MSYDILYSLQNGLQRLYLQFWMSEFIKHIASKDLIKKKKEVAGRTQIEAANIAASSTQLWTASSTDNWSSHLVGDLQYLAETD